MRLEMDQLKNKVDNQANLERAMDALLANGLVKRGTTHEFEVVNSFEEHLKLKKQKLDEAAAAREIEQQMKNQPAYVPSDERQRAGNQLEIDPMA